MKIEKGPMSVNYVVKYMVMGDDTCNTCDDIHTVTCAIPNNQLSLIFRYLCFCKLIHWFCCPYVYRASLAQVELYGLKLADTQL